MILSFLLATSALGQTPARMDDTAFAAALAAPGSQEGTATPFAVDTAAIQEASAVLAYVGGLPAAGATRGKELKQFRQLAPTVVKVVVLDSEGKVANTGTGVVINSHGDVVTNWHLLQGRPRVSVVPKPAEGAQPEVLTATVRRVDEVADLAIVNAKGLAGTEAAFAELREGPLAIGDEVLAINQAGLSWAYTEGSVISLDSEYKFRFNAKLPEHTANVVGVNLQGEVSLPGVPVFDDKRRLAGILAYTKSTDGLVYAIGAEHVKALPNLTKDRLGVWPKQGLRPEAVDQNNDGRVDLVKLDTDENGKWDQVQVDSNNDGKFDTLYLDRNENGKVDGVAYDNNGDGQADAWEFDDNEDGKPDRVAYDKDGDGEVDVMKKV